MIFVSSLGLADALTCALRTWRGIAGAVSVVWRTRRPARNNCGPYASYVRRFSLQHLFKQLFRFYGPPVRTPVTPRAVYIVDLSRFYGKGRPDKIQAIHPHTRDQRDPWVIPVPRAPYWLPFEYSPPVRYRQYWL
jgi:hypothetical protein